MKKQIIYYRDTSLRCGCVYNGVEYKGGEKCAYLSKEDKAVCELDVKTLAVHMITSGRCITKEKKIMELEKRNGSLAIVRDEYDNRYVALLCETYYSEYAQCIKIYDAIVTPFDKTSAELSAKKGTTKKRWVVSQKWV